MQENRNKCNSCGQSFASESELREHKKSHRQGSGSERGGSSGTNPGRGSKKTR